MPQLRLSPSGPPIVGVNAGDILIWNPLTYQWNIGAAPSVATEFDHLISTRADLVAVAPPVAGEIVLPSGSYFFKQAINLNDGERVVVDSEAVFLMGGGRGLERGFRGNYALNSPAFIVRNGGLAELINMTIGAVQPGRHGVQLDGFSNLKCSLCTFTDSATGTQPTLALNAGTSTFEETLIGLSLNRGVAISGGSKHVFRRCEIRAGNGDGIDISLPESTETEVSILEGKVSSSVEPALTLAGDDLTFQSVATDYTTTADEGRVISAERYRSMRFAGGITRGPNLIGFAFAGASLFSTIEGMEGRSLASFVEHLSGTQRGVVIDTCTTLNDVTIGVSWASGSIPAMGLCVMGCKFDTVTPITGHVATDTDVIHRGNFGAGGALIETPITV